MSERSACFHGAAAHCLRIALGLKGLGEESLAACPSEPAGRTRLPAGYRRLRPAGALPALADRDLALSQALAIIEYLDEAFPYPPLLPADPGARAQVRAIALDLAGERHPISHLDLPGSGSEADRDPEREAAWCRHWLESGLAAVEARVAPHPADWKFCHGRHPTLADCCLAPQVFNARRLGCRLDGMPTVVRIDAEYRNLPAFVAAEPGDSR